MGDLTLTEAWALLAADDRAVMIDVRTRAEWNFVGIPDLTATGRQLRTVEWVTFPDGAPNPAFVSQASDGLDREAPVLLLCRSGVRSAAAAIALEGIGFADTHNVVAGFEGDLDENGHRHGGWKDHLPWRQS